MLSGLSVWRRLGLQARAAGLSEPARIASATRRVALRWVVAAATVAGLLVLLVPGMVAVPIDITAGDRVREPIYAPPGFVFHDRTEARARAEREIPPRWRLDADVAAENIRLLGDLGLPIEEREALRAYLGREPAAGEIFGFPQEVAGPARVERALRHRGLGSERRAGVLKVLRPSVLVDEAATAAARDAWSEAHPPAEERFDGRAPVVPADAVLTAREAEIVRQIDRYRSKSSVFAAVGLAAVAAVLVALMALYIRLYAAASFRRTRDVAALSLAVLLATAATVFFRSAAGAIDLPGRLTLTTALAPVATTSMLVSVIFSPRLGIIAAAFVAVLTGLAGDARFDLLAAFILGSAAAAFGVRRARRRESLFAAGAVAGLTQALVVAAASMTRRVPTFPFSDVLSAFVGAAIAAPVIVIGTLYIFERLFGLTTNFRLLELSDLNHPVMRQMLLEAPGTYQHSLTVASLAETAAEAIGANSLLARVGCQFHDVGKLRKPEYFTENQAAGENPHEGIKPSLSAQILKAHVKDGIARAVECGLPEAVVRFIPEHHGTSVMAFFYNKALEEAGVDPESGLVDRSDFRYEGPRPQSQETAIAMLADAVEAACRALVRPSSSKVAKTVNKVVNQKFSEGELDECDITLKDLHLIAESFTKVLCGMYHVRTVDYPEKEEIEEAERRARLAANGAGT